MTYINSFLDMKLLFLFGIILLCGLAFCEEDKKEKENDPTELKNLEDAAYYGGRRCKLMLSPFLMLSPYFNVISIF